MTPEQLLFVQQMQGQPVQPQGVLGDIIDWGSRHWSPPNWLGGSAEGGPNDRRGDPFPGFQPNAPRPAIPPLQQFLAGWGKSDHSTFNVRDDARRYARWARHGKLEAEVDPNDPNTLRFGHRGEVAYFRSQNDPNVYRNSITLQQPLGQRFQQIIQRSSDRRAKRKKRRGGG